MSASDAQPDPSQVELLRRAYAAFNARDIDGALAAMHADVTWPNGMDGGDVHGHDEVRAYWTRQWQLIDPRVDPVNFRVDDQARIVVDVHQVVRTLSGDLTSDQMVQHIYVIERGLVRRMEISSGTPMR